MDFMQPEIARALDECDGATLDTLEFGVIRMTLDGVIDGYNSYEAQLSGLPASRVLGKNLFLEVAPCTNNCLVAARFEESQILDETIPYVFTLRMRPRKVELRMVKTQTGSHQYLLVRNR